MLLLAPARVRVESINPVRTFIAGPDAAVKVINYVVPRYDVTSGPSCPIGSRPVSASLPVNPGLGFGSLLSDSLITVITKLLVAKVAGRTSSNSRSKSARAARKVTRQQRKAALVAKREARVNAVISRNIAAAEQYYILEAARAARAEHNTLVATGKVVELRYFIKQLGSQLPIGMTPVWRSRSAGRPTAKPVRYYMEPVEAPVNLYGNIEMDKLDYSSWRDEMDNKRKMKSKGRRDHRVRIPVELSPIARREEEPIMSTLTMMADDAAAFSQGDAILKKMEEMAAVMQAMQAKIDSLEAEKAAVAKPVTKKILPSPVRTQQINKVESKTPKDLVHEAWLKYDTTPADNLELNKRVVEVSGVHSRPLMLTQVWEFLRNGVKTGVLPVTSFMTNKQYECLFEQFDANANLKAKDFMFANKHLEPELVNLAYAAWSADIMFEVELPSNINIATVLEDVDPAIMAAATTLSKANLFGEEKVYNIQPITKVAMPVTPDPVVDTNDILGCFDKVVAKVNDCREYLAYQLDLMGPGDDRGDWLSESLYKYGKELLTGKELLEYMYYRGELSHFELHTIKSMYKAGSAQRWFNSDNYDNQMTMTAEDCDLMEVEYGHREPIYTGVQTKPFLKRTSIIGEDETEWLLAQYKAEVTIISGSAAVQVKPTVEAVEAQTIVQTVVEVPQMNKGQGIEQHKTSGVKMIRIFEYNSSYPKGDLGNSTIRAIVPAMLLNGEFYVESKVKNKDVKLTVECNANIPYVGLDAAFLELGTEELNSYDVQKSFLALRGYTDPTASLVAMHVCKVRKFGSWQCASVERFAHGIVTRDVMFKDAERQLILLQKLPSGEFDLPVEGEKTAGFVSQGTRTLLRNAILDGVTTNFGYAQLTAYQPMRKLLAAPGFEGTNRHFLYIQGTIHDIMKATDKAKNATQNRIYLSSCKVSYIDGDITALFSANGELLDPRAVTRTAPAIKVAFSAPVIKPIVVAAPVVEEVIEEVEPVASFGSAADYGVAYSPEPINDGVDDEPVSSFGSAADYGYGNDEVDDDEPVASFGNASFYTDAVPEEVYVMEPIVEATPVVTEAAPAPKVLVNSPLTKELASLIRGVNFVKLLPGVPVEDLVGLTSVETSANWLKLIYGPTHTRKSNSNGTIIADAIRAYLESRTFNPSTVDDTKVALHRGGAISFHRWDWKLENLIDVVNIVKGLLIAVGKTADIMDTKTLEDGSTMITICGGATYFTIKDKLVYDDRDRVFMKTVLHFTEKIKRKDTLTEVHPVSSIGNFMQFVWYCIVPLISSWVGQPLTNLGTNVRILLSNTNVVKLAKLSSDKIAGQNGARFHNIDNTWCPVLWSKLETTTQRGDWLGADILSQAGAKELGKRYRGKSKVDTDFLVKGIELAFNSYNLGFHFSDGNYMSECVSHVDFRRINKAAHPALYALVLDQYGVEMFNKIMSLSTKASKGGKRITLSLAQGAPIVNPYEMGWILDNQRYRGIGHLIATCFAPTVVFAPGVSIHQAGEDRKPVIRLAKTTRNYEKQDVKADDLANLFKVEYTVLEGVEMVATELPNGFTEVTFDRPVPLKGEGDDVIVNVLMANGLRSPIRHEAAEAGNLINFRYKLQYGVQSGVTELVTEYTYTTDEYDAKYRSIAKAMTVTTSLPILTSEHNSDLGLVELIHFQDAIKADVIYSWLMVIGNTVRYNPDCTDPKFIVLRDAVAEVNGKVTGVYEYANGIHINSFAVSAQMYADVIAKFQALFGRSRTFKFRNALEFSRMMEEMYVVNRREDQWFDITTPEQELAGITVITDGDVADEHTNILYFYYEKGLLVGHDQAGYCFASTESCTLWNVEIVESTTLSEAVGSSVQLFNYVRALAMTARDPLAMRKQQEAMVKGSEHSILMAKLLNGFKCKDQGLDDSFEYFRIDAVGTDVTLTIYGDESADAGQLALNRLYEILAAHEIDLSLNVEAKSCYKDLCKAFSHIVFVVNGQYTIWMPGLWAMSHISTDNQNGNSLPEMFFKDILIPLLHGKAVAPIILNSGYGKLCSFTKSANFVKLLNGLVIVGGKRMAIPDLASGEVVVRYSLEPSSVYQELVRRFGEHVVNAARRGEVVAVYSNRAPISGGAVQRLLIEEVNEDGIHYLTRNELSRDVVNWFTGITQIGCNMIDNNIDFGDFDGESVYLTLLDKVPHSEIHDLPHVKKLMKGVLGVEMFSKACNQYARDHYDIKPWVKVSATLESLNKTVAKYASKPEELVRLNQEATIIQWSLVGTTYDVYMYGDHAIDITKGFVGAGLAIPVEFQALNIAEANEVFQKVTSGYEVALGGHSPATYAFATKTIMPTATGGKSALMDAHDLARFTAEATAFGMFINPELHDADGNVDPIALTAMLADPTTNRIITAVMAAFNINTIVSGVEKGLVEGGLHKFAPDVDALEVHTVSSDTILMVDLCICGFEMARGKFAGYGGNIKNSAKSFKGIAHRRSLNNVLKFRTEQPDAWKALTDHSIVILGLELIFSHLAEELTRTVEVTVEATAYDINIDVEETGMDADEPVSYETIVDDEESSGTTVCDFTHAQLNHFLAPLGKAFTDVEDEDDNDDDDNTTDNGGNNNPDPSPVPNPSDAGGEELNEVKWEAAVEEFKENMNNPLPAVVVTPNAAFIPNAGQQLAIDALAAGNDILILGQAGSGKSKITEHIRNEVAPALGLKVISCASTGVASLNWKSDGTLNSIFKIGIGFSDRTVKGLDYPAAHKALVRKAIKNSTLKSRFALSPMDKGILVVVDEVFMVDARIELVIRDIAREAAAEGTSIQWLIVGDPMQLEQIGADAVAMYKPHTRLNQLGVKRATDSYNIVVLKQAMRQIGNTAFVNELNALAVGELLVEEGTVIYDRIVASVKEESPKDAIHVYCENHEVIKHNARVVASMKGQRRIYKARIDVNKLWGSTEEERLDSKLKQIERMAKDVKPIEASMEIVVGMKVMIRKNLSANEVMQIDVPFPPLKSQHIAANGSRGEIVQVFDRSVSVLLETGNTIGIPMMGLDVPEYNNEAIGVFEQLPLCPAYAMTAHKVQGLTINYPLVWHPYHSTEKGYAYKLGGNNNPDYGKGYVAMSRVTSPDLLWFEVPGKDEMSETDYLAKLLDYTRASCSANREAVQWLRAIGALGEANLESPKTINVCSADKNGYEGLSTFNLGPIPMAETTPDGQVVNFEYKTVEHWYQVKKAMFAGDDEAAQRIYESSSPAAAKAAGTTVKGLDVKAWNAIAVKEMFDCLSVTFHDVAWARELLVSTAGSKLTNKHPFGASLGVWEHEYPRLLEIIREYHS